MIFFLEMVRRVLWDEIEKSLQNWGQQLENVHLPRWHELPDIELYMDQVITLIEKYLSPLITLEKHTLLTSSMVNNYVKHGLIPAPVKSATIKSI